MRKLAVSYILLLFVMLMIVALVGCQQQPTPPPTPGRIVSERFIVEIDRSSWIPESLTVSPDGRRVAYMDKESGTQFVVVDGTEGKQYNVIITANGGGISFDSSNSFHYLAFKGDSVYLVEERVG
jgi:hypothetical protein